jgi:hypothetical protein
VHNGIFMCTEASGAISSSKGRLRFRPGRWHHVKLTYARGPGSERDGEWRAVAALDVGQTWGRAEWGSGRLTKRRV